MKTDDLNEKIDMFCELVEEAKVNHPKEYVRMKLLEALMALDFIDESLISSNIIKFPTTCITCLIYPRLEQSRRDSFGLVSLSHSECSAPYPLAQFLGKLES
jgi:hypothetical protein